MVSLVTVVRNIISAHWLNFAMQAKADSDEVYAQIMLQPEVDVSVSL